MTNRAKGRFPPSAALIREKPLVAALVSPMKSMAFSPTNNDTDRGRRVGRSRHRDRHALVARWEILCLTKRNVLFRNTTVGIHDPCRAL